MSTTYDCIVAGSCVVDLLCRPVDLSKPIGYGALHETEPVLLTGGGITSNSGITMARMGMKVAVLSYVGKDAWAPVIRNLYKSEGVDDAPLLTHPTAATSTTVVAIDAAGERSFLHCVGAPKLINAAAFLDQIELFKRTRMLLVGYYSLMPNLESDLPEVFRQVRAQGCKTALDAAGAGGSMQPLDRILPQLDVYVPSLGEAIHQTGVEDPKRIIEIYRGCGAPGLLGVKLGKQGVLLSPTANEYLQIPIATPPGPVVDTTGAGDSFYAGLLTGLLKGLPVEQAGKLGAAAGAICVTAIGGCTGGKSFAATAQLAGLAT
ncbi:MAG: carbohydrate kinase family protein [Phycisphaeraceae bacterium]